VNGPPAVRALYLDLDGTLLGRGASMLHDGEGAVTIDGVRAVQACLRADVEVVLMSGRRRTQVFEDARLLGQRSFIFEAGACVVIDGEEHWLTGEYEPGERSIAEQIELAGAPALLLEEYVGQLEYHEPWHVDREVSHLFRGLVDAADVDRLLAERGHGGLRLVDNGVVSRRSPALADLSHVRGYHLVPAGASKVRAVELHRATSASRPSRSATRARISRARSRSRASGWSRMRSSAIPRSARSRRPMRTSASPRPATAPACMKPW
jgi:hypothetical protein